MFIEHSKIFTVDTEKLVYNSQLIKQNLSVEEIVRISNRNIPDDLPLVSTTYTNSPSEEDMLEVLLSDILLRVRKLQGKHRLKVAFFHQLDTQELLFLFTTYKKYSIINPLEEAIVLHQLNKEGFTHKEIANILNTSRSYVTNKIRLLFQPRELVEAVVHKRITEGHAKVLMGLEDKVTKLNLLAAVESDKLSVKQTAKLVSTFKGLGSRKRPKREEKIEKELSTVVKAFNREGVEIETYIPKRRKGYVAKLTIYFRDARAISSLKDLVGK